MEDDIVWSRNDTDQVSTKEICAMLMENVGKNRGSANKKKFWRKIWAMPVRPKWKFFIWRIFHKVLALGSNLEKRGIVMGNKCCLCKNRMEYEEHLFRNCHLIARVWLGSWLCIQVQSAEYIP